MAIEFKFSPLLLVAVSVGFVIDGSGRAVIGQNRPFTTGRYNSDVTWLPFEAKTMPTGLVSEYGTAVLSSHSSSFTMIQNHGH